MTKSRTEELADQLRDHITAGLYAPGERLPPAKIMATYGSTRNVTKQALRVLLDEGLLRSQQGPRGHYVADPDDDTAPSSIPLYQWVADALRHMIQNGVFKPHEQLPPLLELAAQNQVAVMTIRTAMDVLSSEGLVYRVRGVGTYVAGPDETLKDPAQ